MSLPSGAPRPRTPLDSEDSSGSHICESRAPAPLPEHTRHGRTPRTRAGRPGALNEGGPRDELRHVQEPRTCARRRREHPGPGRRWRWSRGWLAHHLAGHSGQNHQDRGPEEGRGEDPEGARRHPRGRRPQQAGAGQVLQARTPGPSRSRRRTSRTRGPSRSGRPSRNRESLRVRRRPVYVDRGNGPSRFAAYSASLGSPAGTTTGGHFRFTCTPSQAPCKVSLGAAVFRLRPTPHGSIRGSSSTASPALRPTRR